MNKVIMLILTIGLLSGCGLNNNGDQNDKQHLIGVKNSTIENIDRKTGQDISEHLVNLASKIPNVNDATAVVLGNYAIVGIDVKANLDRSEVGAIKYSVAESLRNDPHGARAVVVADPDITARLKEISEDIQNGEPVQGIVNELADISGRLMPEIPADIIDPKSSKGTEDPKKKLDENEDRKLEDKQEKQSNYYKN